MKARDLSIDDIKIGDSISFERTFTESDVTDFAKLSGDENPLHLDDVYAEKTKFKRRLVHGMLVGSLCSRVVGMYLPGKRCLYLKQDLVFRNPVFIGDRMVVTGKVVSKSISTKTLEVEISVLVDNKEVLSGNALVQVL